MKRSIYLLGPFIWAIIIMLIILSIIAIISIIQFVRAEEQSFRVTLNTPSITFRDKYVGDTIRGYVGFENKNNFSITVELIPDSSNIFLARNKILDIEPDSINRIDYDINLLSSGNYESGISVKFSHNQENITPKSFVLLSQLKFINISQRPTNNPPTYSGNGGSSSSGGSSSNRSGSPSGEEEQNGEGEEAGDKIGDGLIPEKVGNDDKKTGFTQSINWVNRIYYSSLVLIVLSGIILIIYLIKKQKSRKEELDELGQKLS